MTTASKAKTEQTELREQKKAEELNHSERFVKKVLAEFGSNSVGEIRITEYQRQLIFGYFIGIDRALKMAEDNRLRKNKNNSDSKYNNDLAVTWNNVNLGDLALDVVHYARMGLDMLQDNHLFPIPYRNNKAQKYDITLMKGYNGIRYIAEKYAIEKPKAVIAELVYSTDTFKPYKKSHTNKMEGYDFIINNPFDRGDIVGGFGYIEYEDPHKNKLIIMSMRDIEKRKPQYASAEFWGGTKKEWKNGKQVETQTEGWFEEMCLKTVKREVYSAKHIPIDPQKVDESYQHIKMRDARLAELEAQAVIDSNANSMVIDTTEVSPAPPGLLLEDSVVVDHDTGEVLTPRDHETAAEPAIGGAAEQTALDPDF